MTRAVRAAAVCASAVAVSAAPVPPPSEKERVAKYWGLTEGAGEFELAGKQLTLRTAGQPARGLLHGPRMTMPRTARTLCGDFVVTVKVIDATPPDPMGRHEEARPVSRAGLLLSGGGYGIELHLHQLYQKLNGAIRDDLDRVVWVDTWFPGGGAGRSREKVPAGKSTYLRVTRKDKAVTVSHSFDGTEWAAPLVPRQGLDFPDEVTAGVFLAHSTYQRASATFDPLIVEKPK